MTAPRSSPGTAHLNFFGENVDAWGAAEWFNRLAAAVRQQDAAVLANDDATMEICRNVAASSAMRLVRDYEQQVRSALRGGVAQTAPRPQDLHDVKVLLQAIYDLIDDEEAAEPLDYAIAHAKKALEILNGYSVSSTDLGASDPLHDSRNPNYKFPSTLHHEVGS